MKRLLFKILAVEASFDLCISAQSLKSKKSFNPKE